MINLSEFQNSKPPHPSNLNFTFELGVYLVISQVWVEDYHAEQIWILVSTLICKEIPKTIFWTGDSSYSESLINLI